MSTTVLITGGTSGIGLALAKKYLSMNHNVIITGRSPDKIAMAEEELKKYPNFIMAKNIDVTNAQAMTEFLEHCDDTYSLDIIIANAGISAGATKCKNREEFDKLGKDIFNTNVFGVFNTIHPMIDRMKARKYGKIVIIGSLTAFFGLRDVAFYSASKAAIKNYGEGLRLLLEPYNINVTNVFPGFVESNITKTNTFKMPFIMSGDKAAEIIVSKVSANKGYVLFPLRLSMIVYIVKILPFCLREIIARKFPDKSQ